MSEIWINGNNKKSRTILERQFKMQVLHLFFLLISCVFQKIKSQPAPPVSSTYNIPTSEYTALQDFYFQLGGLQWNWLPYSNGVPWVFTPTSNPCLEKWQGITCEGNAATNTSRVISIYLNRHNLVGRIPDSMKNFTALKLVGLNGNRITGPIPTLFGDLKRLQVIGMSNNELTGKLPEVLSSLSLLNWLDVNQNQLTGSIPDSYASLVLLNNFDLYGNLLTGTIPEFIGTFSQLSYLFLGRNGFVGTIPASVGHLSRLEYLSLDHNELQGSVPASFASLARLEFFYLFNNALTGHISNIFNASAQQSLSVVSLSGNQFTGQLPDEVFRLPNISTLDAGSNCFRGSLPSTICLASNLVSFVFDGANAASTCHTQLLPGLAGTYKIQHPFTGGIPHCVYSLPFLRTLQLASNGFTGKLPRSTSFGAEFVNLSLSYNFLEGTIPKAFQEHPWVVFDVSYNKFKGLLSSNFSTQTNATQLSMRNNRLSGDIPETIVHSPGFVSVLQGNVFTCETSEDDLPANDQNVGTYTCGSNSFNASYYFWVTTSGVMFVLAVFVFVVRKNGAVRDANSAVPLCSVLQAAVDKARTVLDILTIRDAENERIVSQLRRYNKVSNIAKMLLNMSVFVAVLAVFIMLPYYGIISEYFGTHTYQYAYQVSIIYKSGVVPLVLGMFLLLVLLVVIFFRYGVAFRQYQSDIVLFERDIEYRPSDASCRDSYSHVEDVVTAEKVLLYLGYGVVDLIVVFGANIAFVYVVLYKSHRAVFFAQAALSVFKIAWSNVCSITTHYLASEMEFESQNIKKGLLTMLFLITLFNNIVVPCLVMMAVSTSCFYNIFVPGENVTYSGYVHCVEYNLDRTCRTRELYTESRSLQAPFVYTYECSSSFLTAYAPSFVYLCIIQGLLTPAMRWCGQKLYLCTSDRWLLHRLLRYYLPAILKPLHTIPRKMFTPRFDARMMIVTLLNYLAVIMTFGMVFPPLAVSMAVTIVSTVFWSRLEVKNYLTEAAARGMSEHINLIDECCAGVGSDTMLLRAIWVLIGLSCWFYTLFLFDTLGDDVGLSGAYWVLIVMPLMPFVLYGSFKLHTGTFFVRRRERMVSSVRIVGTNLDLLRQIQMETLSPMSKPTQSRDSAEESKL